MSRRTKRRNAKRRSGPSGVTLPTVDSLKAGANPPRPGVVRTSGAAPDLPMKSERLDEFFDSDAFNWGVASVIFFGTIALVGHYVAHLF